MGDTAVSRNTARWALRVLVVGYLILPRDLARGVGRAGDVRHGLAPVIDAMRQPEVIFAFQLTLSAAFWAVVINTIFGVGISLLLVRYTFRGRRTLNALVDLPLAVSPSWSGCLWYWSTAGVRAGWAGLGAGWFAGHLRSARDHPGHGVRQHATGDSRGRPGAPRDRD